VAVPSAIIRAWTTEFRGPHPSLSYPITLYNAASASAECSATIGPLPDECRWFFWTIRDMNTVFAILRYRLKSDIILIISGARSGRPHLKANNATTLI
jgi:hypothetical protein